MAKNMRKPFIAGNWKMHNTIEQSRKLAEAVKKAAQNKQNIDVMISPSSTALNTVSETIKGSNIILAAQDCCFESSGAFTGAVSYTQVKDAGASVALAGHSERRNIFGDTNEIVNKKVKAIINSDMTAVFCIGETLKEREANATFAILETQIKEGLEGIAQEQTDKIIIAYEPVWAIGTGQTASPAQAEQAHKFIRDLISKLFTGETAEKIRIIYGGSVKPDNIDSIMSEPDIDGVLVGGASLKPESFEGIINFKVEE